MRLQQIKTHDNLGVLPGEDFKVVLTPHMMQKVISSTINDYSDVKGSIVRECVSNSFDAELAMQEALTLSKFGFNPLECVEVYDKFQVYVILRERGLKEDDEDYTLYITYKEYLESRVDIHRLEKHLNTVEVAIKEPIVLELGNDFIQFKDYGIGLSPERVRFIYTSLFVSTKTNSNNKIGAFGRGAKSPYAYSDSFEVTTIFNNTKYYYLMTYGDSGIPRMELLNKESTKESNGTTVEIPIKKSGAHYREVEREREEWKRAITFQTRYFENIYLIGVFGNGTKIHKGKYYSYVEGNTHDTIQLLLGQVPYNVDWSLLGVKKIQVPIALNFEIGELQPTPNREGIILDKHAKKIILKRLKDAATELIEKSNKQRHLMKDLKEYIAQKKSLNIKFERIIYLHTLHEYSRVKVTPVTYSKLPSFTKTIFPRGMFNRLQVYQKITKKISKYNIEYNYLLNINDTTPIYLKNGRSITKNNVYLADKYTVVYLLKVSDFKLKDWVNFLELKNYPNKLEKDGSTWRRMIQEYLDFEKEHITFPSYDNLVVPKTYTPVKRNALQDTEIRVHKLRKAESTYNDRSTFDTTTIDKDDLKLKKFIYSSYQDEKQLKVLTPLLNKFTIVSVPKRSLALFANHTHISKVFSLDEVKEIYTSVYIYHLFRKYQYIFQNKAFLLTVSPSIHKTFAKVQSYAKNDNYVLLGEFQKQYEKCRDKKDWSPAIKKDLIELEKLVRKFEYLKFFKTTYMYPGGSQIPTESYKLAKHIYDEGLIW